MKILLLKTVERFICLLEIFKNKLIDTKPVLENSTYFQLSPINDLQKSSEYITALNWAIKNRKEKDIKNIALTGPYGAGKSSILKTFQQNCHDKDVHFLDISLATFKEEVVEEQENNDDVSKTSTTQLRQIEISILQQIFYHEEDSKIPDSRFKKIKVSSKRNLAIRSIAIVAAIVSSFWLFSDKLSLHYAPNFLSSITFFKKTSFLLILGLLCYLSFSYLKKESRKLYLVMPLVLILVNIGVLLFFGSNYIFNIPSTLSGFNIAETFNTVFIDFVVLYLLVFFYFLIKEGISFLNKISVNKLKIQDAEIEIGAKHQKSVMNQHLDEILYFFSVRPYNVVIIEDLDRFKQTEIFTKLREINLLLNQSEKTKEKNIVFIYAVRDEMFQDKDRTKFFDFIVPVIPTINASNSSQILLTKNTKNKYQLSEEFIENISFVIDDMRLLHNICNEYYLYKSLLSQQLDPEKLFAIIAYKNILPNDFVQLSNSEGELYELLNFKQEFITKINIAIDVEITEIKKELVILESNHHNKIEDLRKIYILKLIEKLNNFSSFLINNTTVTIDQLTETENFNYIIDNGVMYNKVIMQNYSLVTAKMETGVKFNEIEREVNSKKGYRIIEKEIEEINNGELNTKKLKIRALESTKTSNRNKRLVTLLQDPRFKMEDHKTEDKKNDFLLTFVRNGYISEDFIEYVSIFHEGSISRNDHSFYINVQNRNVQDYDYKLARTANLINKINMLDFKTEYIFNFNLMDFVLENQQLYSEQLESILEKLSDESQVSVSFIIACYENIINIKELTVLITKEWANFWTFVGNSKSIDNITLEAIFEAAIKYAKIDGLKNISQGNNFKQKIYSNPLFLNIVKDQNRIVEIIGELDIDFESLDLENSPKKLAEYVYESWHYVMNVQNIEVIIKYFGEFNQVDFDKSNYKAVQESECPKLIEYLDSFINDYISNVYLSLNNNNSEQENYYAELLDKENISEKNLELIIQKVNTKIHTVSNLKNMNAKLMLLNHNKIKETWENVLQYLDDESNTEAIVSYLNNTENSQLLGAQKVSKELNTSNEYIYSENYMKILHLNNISEESYTNVVAANPWFYETLDLETIAEEKLKILLKSKAIGATKKTFEALKLHHQNLLIYLIESQSPKIIALIEELIIDITDLEPILGSENIGDNVKQLFLKKIEDADILLSPECLVLLSKIKALNDVFEISDLVLQEILLNKKVDHRNKIKIFNRNSSKLTTQEIVNFINTLPAKFVEIPNRDKRALIDNNGDNLTFLEILKGRQVINSYKSEKNGLRISHKKK